MRTENRDHSASFEELPKRDKSATIHQRNLQMIATENFETKNGFKAEIMKNIFIFTEPAYHLLGNNLLERHSVKSARCGHETVYHLGPKNL